MYRRERQVRRQLAVRRPCSERAKILDLAGAIREVDDLGVAGQQHEIMCGGGGHREAVRERNRSASLQSGDLDHPGGPGQVQRKGRSQICECPIGRVSSLIALHAVVDLNQIDPARQGSIRKDSIDAGDCGLFSVQLGQDRPGVQTDAHRGSRARSSSRRLAMPVFANRPPKRGDVRLATSTISLSRI